MANYEKTLFIVYDNGSYIHWFPQNVAYLYESVTCTDVTIYNQDIHHYEDNHITDILDNQKFDLVCLGFIGGYYQYKKCLSISDAVNKSKNRHKFTFVLGGHGPSPEPQYFLKKFNADIIVIGEGEEALRSIAHGQDLKFIPGIMYKNNDNYILNENSNFKFDVNRINWPKYNKFNIEYYRLIDAPNKDKTEFAMPVLSGRGCPYKCNFCYRMEDGFRARNSQDIIEEIKYLNRNWRINYIIFSDELLMTSRSRVEDLCNRLKPLKIKWNCNGRLNLAAKDKSLLKLMKDSGCVFINYGIESVDDKALALMNKKLTVKEIIKGVENTIEIGISPGLNIIFGNYGETTKSLFDGVKFIQKYGDGSQLRTIRPVTPYPGSQLYKDAIQQGKIKNCEDFYENKHINSDLMTCNFSEVSDEEFYKALCMANTSLAHTYYHNKYQILENQMTRLYFNDEEWREFRGFRQY